MDATPGIVDRAPSCAQLAAWHALNADERPERWPGEAHPAGPARVVPIFVAQSKRIARHAQGGAGGQSALAIDFMGWLR